jgi:hypothetical protein
LNTWAVSMDGHSIVSSCHEKDNVKMPRTNITT